MTPRPTRDLAVAKSDLECSGYCLVEGALSPDEVVTARARLDAAARGGSGLVRNVISKDSYFLELARNSVAMEFADHVLGPDFILWGANAMIQAPGAVAQVLHPSQEYVPPPWPYPLTLGVVWMLDAYTLENGATLVVPGSHRADVKAPRGLRTFDQWLAHAQFASPLGEAIPVTGPAGTAFILDSRLWHQAGPNMTASFHRHGLQVTYCRPFMRPQVSYPLSLPKKVLEQAKESSVLRRLLGYELYYDLIGVIEPPPEG